MIPETTEDAVKAASLLLNGDEFGEAGKEVVIEEFLSGVEVSVFALCDGQHVVPMVPAQDHKRAHEFDQGLNTGGMGAIAPSPLVDAATFQQIVDRVLQPTVQGLQKDGTPFVGVLFAGLMLSPATHGGKWDINVLEYNVRFGDPETQVVLPLLHRSCDLLSVMMACTAGQLDHTPVRFATQLPGTRNIAASSIAGEAVVKIGGVEFVGPPQSAVAVVAVSGGYPGSYSKGAVIDLGSNEEPSGVSVQVYHAGTAIDAESHLVTSGGRVLAVSAVAPSLRNATWAAYQRLNRISFHGMTYRRDIGGVYVAQEAARERAAVAAAAAGTTSAAQTVPTEYAGWYRRAGPVRIGVLGSTNGTDMVSLADSIQQGTLQGKAEIVQVISNRSSAGIVDNCKRLGLPVAVVASKGKAREAFDRECISLFDAADVDVVLLIGFMRIVSSALVHRYAWRLLNVHPSLLPAFGGGMDKSVHEAVLEAGVSETGCTVHFVDTGVDTGAHLTQRALQVSADDTPETLKKRVQSLEADALIDAVQLFGQGGGLLQALVAAKGVYQPQLLASLPQGSVPAGILDNPPVSSSTATTSGLTYAAAGVDIDAGNSLVEQIKPAVKSTRRPGADGAIGGFGGVFDLKAAGYEDPLLVSGTDGVGTKLKLAGLAGDHSTIGIDAVAMCVNDILSQGAEPLFFLDYFATGHLAVQDAAAVVGGIAMGCRQSGCALLGGETAEMPGMYADGEYDIAGFAVGAVDRARLLPKPERMVAGDVVLALPSSGVHSNGFSLVRKIVQHVGADWHAPCPFPTPRDTPATGSGAAASTPSLAAALLTPTRLYVKSVLAALKTTAGEGIAGLAHITGGGLPENLPRAMPAHLTAELNTNAWPHLPVFRWLQAAGGVSDKEMYRTFNMGVGMAIIVRHDCADAVAHALTGAGEQVYRIGVLRERDGDEPQVKLGCA